MSKDFRMGFRGAVLLLLSVAFSPNAGASRHCGSEQFHPRQPRQPISAWSKTTEIQALRDSYSFLKFRSGRRPEIQIQPLSLFDSFPELSRILDDLSYDWIHLSALRDRWMASTTQEPLLSEINFFYQNRIQILMSGLNEWSSILRESHPTLSWHIQTHWIRKLRVSNLELQELFRMDSPLFLNSIDEQNKLIQSRFAELYVLGSVSNPIGYSIELGQMETMVRRLHQKINEAMERIRESPQHLAFLNEQYPILMNNGKIRQWLKQGGDPKSISEKFKLVREWILSKEIDVLTQQPGGLGWIEVKRNRDLITVESLEEVRREGSKTILQQLAENRQILRFLNLDQEIELLFYASGGVSTQAETRLKALGVRVIR